MADRHLLVIQPILQPKDMVAEYLAEGWTALEIRQYMKLSEGMVQAFMKQIRNDLGVPGHD